MLRTKIERRIIDRDDSSRLGESLVVFGKITAVKGYFMVKNRRAVLPVKVKITVICKVYGGWSVGRGGI